MILYCIMSKFYNIFKILYDFYINKKSENKCIEEIDAIFCKIKTREDLELISSTYELHDTPYEYMINSGDTILLFAIRNHVNINIIKFLLEYRVIIEGINMPIINVNKPSYNDIITLHKTISSFLHFANHDQKIKERKNYYEEIIYLLLKYGADSNLCSNEVIRPTPIMSMFLFFDKFVYYKENQEINSFYENQQSFYSILYKLMKYGANPNIPYYLTCITPLYSIMETTYIPIEKETKKCYEFIENIIMLLLYYGADLYQNVAYHTMEGSTDFLQYLMKSDNQIMKSIICIILEKHRIMYHILVQRAKIPEEVYKYIFPEFSKLRIPEIYIVCGKT